MKNPFFLVIIIVGLAWSFAAGATSYSQVCNGCTPQQTGQLLAGGGMPPGDWYILDMVNRRITHYSVVASPVDVDKEHVSLVPITAPVQNDFNHIQALWDVTQTLDIQLSWQSSAKKVAASSQLRRVEHPLALASTGTPVGSDLSAFDLINTPANQAAALNQMMSAAGKWGAASLQLSAALSTFASYSSVTQAIFPRQVNIQVTVKFTDGSTSTFEFNTDQGEWQYKKGASKDAVGNPIPENPDQAVGGSNNNQRYVFPNTPGGVDAAYRQSQNFNNIGLPVGVPVFREGGTWIVACVRTGPSDAQTTTCTVVAQ
ncbi:hypothetical protein [Dyella sp. ASV21]|uniref:hypothetical protein n=1 Tax=Dyella sp. ASV21 TaxID=2795114 RepID=UPI0018EAA6BC|nr:hypothetical protein [Dyella sp. ASV21]